MAVNRQRWQGGLPLHMRDVVWSEDVEALSKQRAEILVTHEGPSSVWKDMGFSVLDDLAAAMGAKWLIHGHHHHSGLSELPNGVRVKALGIAEIWEYPG
jgi:UDP-2,3-diacylglucosamine pyrophosphatase LpxH